MRRAGRALLNLLYPPLCLGCDRPARGGAPLCHRCLNRLERTGPGAAWEQIARRPEAQAVLDDAFCGWRFDKGGTLQNVQHAIKYRNRPRYGIRMGRILGDALTERPACRRVLHRAGLIVPVPLHQTRYLERGYNQSTMLGRGLGQVIGAEVESEALLRERATRSQTSLSHEERWRNVRGAFATSDAAQPVGRRVVLVDDLLTTGATAGAAAQALREAEAASVVLVTLALAR